MIKKALLLLMAGASLIIAPTALPADTHIRWHHNLDDSMLLDDDKYGTRLVLPKEYHEAQIIAERHYCEVNPENVTKLRGGGYTVSYDLAPTRILPSDELADWAQAHSTTWWQYDLLVVVYQYFERRAVILAAADPERAQAILDRKRAEEHIPEPSPALVEDLARHNIKYSGKAAAYTGEKSWRFEVTEPGGVRMFDFPVPVGSSEKVIMEATYEACLSDSRVRVGDERIIVPMSKEMLSWVRW